MAYPGTSSTHDRAQKWLFSKQDMAQAQTIKDGWPAAKELDYRQRATRCIQEMVDKLNEQTRDKSSKLTQLCMCSASVHMHRFYYFHSFERFPYQDVAAACLFLAGKTEESPRKLDHIVHVWWGIKFPKYRRFPQNSTVFNDSKAYIVQLENIILQTIAFDLKINLPHPIVLTLTSKNIDHGNKKLTEVAYFFATDVLCVTNWAIRYSAGEIAVCCVDIVCKFGGHEIPKRTDGLPWYHGICTLELDKLEEMEKEFLIIYNSSKSKLALHKFALKGLVQPLQTASGSSEADIKPDDSILLPPPPPPPTIRNMGINEYRERNKNAPPPPETEKRKSFIPDMSSLPANLTLAPLNLPGMPPLPALPAEKTRDERREEERRKEKERRKEQGKRREERPEDRERRKEEKRREEEKRKRDYNKVVGAGDNNAAQMHKKPRQDIMQHFVPASNNVHHGNNGHHKDYRAIKPEPALSPPRAPPSLSGYGIPQALAPPSMLKAPRNELEEGELE